MNIQQYKVPMHIQFPGAEMHSLVIQKIGDESLQTSGLRFAVSLLLFCYFSKQHCISLVQVHFEHVA